jgi:hypothetical protein
MSDTLTISNARLLEINAGMQDLLSRPFPSPTSRQRASFQFSTLKPALEAYSEGLKPLQEREAALNAMEDSDERTELRKQFGADVAAYLTAEVEIPKPRKMLVEADLPRGEKGSDANAKAILALAPEFFTLSDPDLSE